MKHRKDWTEWRIKRAEEFRWRRTTGECLARVFSTLPENPFLSMLEKKSLPMRGGNTIQFFTYGLSG